MPHSQTIPIRCDTSHLAALARGFEAFGIVGGTPAWLLSAVWFRVQDRPLVVTAVYHVLDDGTVTIPLSIDTPDDIAVQLAEDLPDVQSRILAHGGPDLLPPRNSLAEPELTLWPGNSVAMQVAVRTVRRKDSKHRVACGLLFQAEDRKLLVGTDMSTLALIVTFDESLISCFLESCELLSAAGYEDAFGSVGR